MTMRARQTTHLTLLLAATVLAGCSFSASYSGRWYTGKPDPIRVPSPPPDLDRREQPRQCKGPKLWVFGYWDWKSDAWKWTAGSCKKPPEPGAEWVGPSLYEVEGGYELVPGHWAPPRPAESSGSEAEDDDGRGAGVSVSAGGSVGTGGKKPGNGGKKPGKPGNGGTKPDNGGTKPDNGGTKPDNGGTKPDNGAAAGGGSAGGAAAGGGADSGAGAGHGARPADGRPLRPAGGGATAGADGIAQPAGKQPSKPTGSRPPKPTKPVAGGAAGAAEPPRPDRSNQDGMAQAEDAACRVAETNVEPGKVLVIEVEGPTGRPKARFGSATVRVLKVTDSAVRVRVPKGIQRPVMVTLQYGKTKLACGKVRPAALRKPAKAGQPKGSRDVGARDVEQADAPRRPEARELKK